MKKTSLLIVLALLLVVSCSNSPSTPPSGGFTVDPNQNILYQLKNWAGSISESDKAIIQAALSSQNQTAVWDSSGLTITDNNDGTVLKISSVWPSNTLINQLPSLGGNGEVYCSGYTPASTTINGNAMIYILWTQAQCNAYGTLLENSGFVKDSEYDSSGMQYKIYEKGTIGVILTYSTSLSIPFGITVADNSTP